MGADVGARAGSTMWEKDPMFWELVGAYRPLAGRRAHRGKLIVLKVLAELGGCATYKELYEPYVEEALKWWLRPRNFASFKVMVREMSRRDRLVRIIQRRVGGRFSEALVCLPTDRRLVMAALKEVGMASPPPKPDVDPSQPIDEYVDRLMRAGLIFSWKRNLKGVARYVQETYGIPTGEMLRKAVEEPEDLLAKVMKMGYSSYTAKEVVRLLAEASGYRVRALSFNVAPDGELDVVVKW